MTRTFYPSRAKVAILPKVRGGENTTAEGIIYTEKDNQIYIQGKVASIGLPSVDSSGNEHLPSCNVGDIVYYDRQRAITVEGLDIIPFDAILGVIDESG